ncbi:MAG: T9SS type A sorting domain-containing protein [candidate division Zixibacteria bacterium]|nr:T9SS type A sorting domain-containing protein [candidate division Zixibacteria bacterium]
MTDSVKLRVRTVAAISLAAFSLFLCETSQADRTDFIVNTDGGAVEQNDPRIAVAPDGSFAIVWTDKREGANDVYLQRFDTAGFPINDNIKINDDLPPEWQAQPSLAVDLSSQYGAVWQDFRTDGYPSNPDIFYVPLDTSVTPVGGNTNVTPGYQAWSRENPDISLSAWGAGVVVWADRQSGNWDIFGQLIGSDGSLLGSSFVVNDDGGTAQQHSPRVSTAAAGWFVVTWYDDRLGNDDIFVQRFDAGGNALGVNVRVNSDSGTKRQTFPDVATDGEGNFTVVWLDYRNGAYPSNPDIYGAKFDTNMTSATGNMRLNTDTTTRAQKYPAIGADRMGNVGIVWSDSTSPTWRIMGQMIDVDGLVREVDFVADTSGDSTKMKPDIALDGTHRYVTWVDRRNGNYDIFASIARYNDPELVVSPTSLDFEMEHGGGVPPVQYVSVEHAGYNRLGFKAFSYNNWISITPPAGETPDSVGVTMASDTLISGTYIGTIMFIDTINHDSSALVAVRLEVESAVLELSAASVSVTTLEGMDTTVTCSVEITNVGVGILDWNASESVSWVELTESSGTAPSTLEVQVNSIGMSAGNYAAAVTIESYGADNSPATLYVLLSVRNDIPLIHVEPQTMSLSSHEPGVLDTFVVLENHGGGVADWEAFPQHDWLVLDHYQGANDDVVVLSIDPSGLVPGTWDTYVDFVDGSAFNGSTRLDLELEYIEDFVDTVGTSPTNVAPYAEGTTAITIVATSNVAELFVPYHYDPTAIVVDSFVFGSGLPLHMDKIYQDDVAQAAFSIRLTSMIPDMSLGLGDYLLGNVYFTAVTDGVTTSLDTLNNDSLYPRIETVSGTMRTPVTISGDIQIEELIEPDYADTVRIAPANLLPFEHGSAQMSLSVTSDLYELFVPYSYNPNAIVVDSFVFSSSLPVFMDNSHQIDTETAMLSIEIASMIPGFFVGPGQYVVGEVYFTAVDNGLTTSLNTVNNSLLYPYTISVYGTELTPTTINGTIQIEKLIEPDFVDTVRIEPTNVVPDEQGVALMTLSVISQISELFLPYHYTQTEMVVDSFVFGSSLPAFMDQTYSINEGEQLFSLSFSSTDSEEYLASGNYILGEVHFTAVGDGITTGLDKYDNGSVYPYIMTFLGSELTPITINGEIEISSSTPVYGTVPDQLPQEVSLGQNYPNPFNAGTVIDYELPRRGLVRLEVYNILGRLVDVLVNDVHSAGCHSVSWDAQIDGGHEAPSGIYFYRLVGENFTAVGKMALVR